MTTHPAYRIAAEQVGWRWSPAHDGYTNESVRRPNYGQNNEDGYVVATDSEDACFMSGIETVQEALVVIGTDRARSAGLI